MSNIVLAGAAFISNCEAQAYLPAQQQLSGTDNKALKAHINERGIRYKDKVTKLALAASKKAMQQAQLIRTYYEDLDDARCAVIASSCFGNLDAVVATAAEIRHATTDSLSPMMLPNASANVMASTLAKWFGLRGPNLFVANGQTSGLDALLLARNLLAKHRVERVLICAAESASEMLQPLYDKSRMTAPVDAACCLVLENQASYHNRINQIGVEKNFPAAFDIELSNECYSQQCFAAEIIIDGKQKSLLTDEWQQDLATLHSASGLVSALVAINYLSTEPVAQVQVEAQDARRMALNFKKVIPAQ